MCHSELGRQSELEAGAFQTREGLSVNKLHTLCDLEVLSIEVGWSGENDPPLKCILRRVRETYMSFKLEKRKKVANVCIKLILASFRRNKPSVIQLRKFQGNCTCEDAQPVK